MRSAVNIFFAKYLFAEKPSLAVNLVVFSAVIVFTYFISDPLLKVIGINFKNYTFGTMSPTQIFSGILLAPVLEEIIFRTHLSFKEEHHFGVLLLIVASAIQFSEIGWFFLSIMGVIFLLILLFYEKSWRLISVKKSKITFWITAVVFCLIHYTNLSEYNFGLVSEIGLLLLAYLPLSLYLGYIRYKHGLIFSILGHSLFNIISVLGNTFPY